MVLQDGGRNEAAVSQEGDDNQSFVVQQGISNSTGNAGTSTGIMQLGDDNFSSVNQAPSNNAKATVAQTGNAERKSVVQGKSVSVRVELGARLIIRKKESTITITTK